MSPNELKQFYKQIVRIKYNLESTRIFEIWGIFIFTSNGFFIYNGYNFRGYSDFHCQLTNLILYDCIPYNEIVSVEDRTSLGIKVSEYFDNTTFSNNIYDFLCGPLYNKSFQFEPFGDIEEDNKGMIYNSYSDTWSYL